MQGTSLPEAWEILTEKLIQVVEENVPVSKVSSAADHKNPYVSHQCMGAIKKKKKTYKMAKNTYITNQTKTTPSTKQQEINSVITELRRSKYNYAKDLVTKIKKTWQ